MDVLPVLKQLVLAPAENEELLKELEAYLNHLLLQDFPGLVQLLYQVDVPEKKVKAALQDHPNEDAGVILAHLLLRRQREKGETKKSFRFPADDSAEERW